MPFEVYIVLIYTRDQAIGEAAFTHLNHTPQRWAALAARQEIWIRQLESATTLEAIQMLHHQHPDLLGHLEIPLQSYLRQFYQLSEALDSALARDTCIMRQHGLEKVLDTAGLLLKGLTHTTHADSPRLCRIIETWRAEFTKYERKLHQETLKNTQIRNPYITGVPLTTALAELFVGREEIAAQIEYLLNTAHAPPILILGQRRMGKTSLLYHLERLLKHDYLPVVLDLLGISSVSSPAAFFYNLARTITRSAQASTECKFPAISRAQFERDPATDFNDWLDNIEISLNGRVMVLAFDEIESLEMVFTKGILDQDLILGYFRYLIQHRRQFKLLFTGVAISPIWATYFINVETVYLGYLTADETRELVEQPVKTEVSYTERALEHILFLTRGHPALLQYLCKAVITIKNHQPTALKREVTEQDVEHAVPDVLRSAQQFFIYLQHEHSKQEQDCLHALASTGALPIGVNQLAMSDQYLKNHFEKLARNGLLEKRAQNQYAFQVELVRRWFLNPV